MPTNPYVTTGRLTDYYRLESMFENGERFMKVYR